MCLLSISGGKMFYVLLRMVDEFDCNLNLVVHEIKKECLAAEYFRRYPKTYHVFPRRRHQSVIITC